MSHDQHFEDLVRSALRDEGMSLPVITTAAQLRERAGGRRRSLSMQTKAMLGVLLPLAAVAAIALVTRLDRPSDLPPVGVSPSPSGLEGSASPTPSSSVAPSSTPASVPFQVETGALITVSQEGPSLRVLSTLAGETTVLYERALDDLGLPNRSEVVGVAVSTTGLLAIPLETRTGGDATYSTALIDMTVPDAPPLRVAGSAAGFGPDGTLVTVERVGLDDVIQRRRPGAEKGVVLLQPVGVSVTPVNGHTLVASDGSGVFASREDPGGERIPVVLRWDGSVVDRTPATRPYADTGVRATGPVGEYIQSGCDTGQTGGGCVANWHAADGTVSPLELPDGAFLGAVAWTSSGDAAYSADGDVLYVVRATDKVVTRLAGLSGGGWIVAVTDAIYVQVGDSLERVAFDGTVAAERIPGELALVVP